MNVMNLEGQLLNFWVAKAAGLKPVSDGRSERTVSILNAASGKLEPYQPIFDWSQAGPVLAEQWDELETMMIDWLGPRWSYMQDFLDQPLTWLMRGVVAIHFGDEVEDWSVDDED
jgi:hypothetical protein